jgi:hypothetical protein
LQGPANGCNSELPPIANATPNPIQNACCS